MILVTGANGQLGTELRHLLDERNEAYVAVDVAEMDITDAEKVDEVLSLSIEERTKLGEKAQQFILDTKNATIQCTKILELIKRT